MSSPDDLFPVPFVRPAPSAVSRRALLALAAGSCWDPVRAQRSFPERPISLIVPFAPGGIADLTARTLAEPMAQLLGQSVVVDNRPSAGGIVGSQAVAGARPDGHTLLLMSNANAVSVGLFKRLPYDTLRDFSPVSLIGSFDLGIFVSAQSRFVSLQALMDFGRLNPGRLNVGTISVGSTQHLAARLFETVAGIDWVVVPYRGTPAVVNALRSGEVDLAVEILGPVLPQLQAGALRGLAVASDERNPAAPELPTALQAGLKGYRVASWNALAAPAGTDVGVIDQLNRVTRAVVATPSVQLALGRLGMRLAASSPADVQALLTAEIQRWGQVIQRAGIQPE
ncbi:MAG: Bug family tripartite tricarboxylate transporter substrate binding protein [Rubrivivax sp.]